MTNKESGEVCWDYPDLSSITPSDKFIFTVDVEEWFQVGAFEKSFDRTEWSQLESRVELQTHNVLSLLEDLSIKATFFCLGWVAERTPRLIKAIAEAGHEVACHGSDHRRLFTLSRSEFEKDIQLSKQLLEEASGQKVLGYRAPSFSLTPDVWWAYECLYDAGFQYSSSLYPVKTDHYGMANAPRKPFYPSKSHGIVEIPMTVCDTPFRRVPSSGGGYFRLLPYLFSKRILKAGSEQAGAPGIYYMHPWEMDPEQPFVSHAPLLSKFRHYTGQKALPSKLGKLASDFSWGTMKGVYASLLESKEGI